MDIPPRHRAGRCPNGAAPSAPKPNWAVEQWCWVLPQALAATVGAGTPAGAADGRAVIQEEDDSSSFRVSRRSSKTFSLTPGVREPSTAVCSAVFPIGSSALPHVRSSACSTHLYDTVGM